jgi:hypothetical protein
VNWQLLITEQMHRNIMNIKKNINVVDDDRDRIILQITNDKLIIGELFDTFLMISLAFGKL